MSIINTNVMSLNSQRNLATNSASLATTIQRLSSGLRINSAKDDAAGLAISERFSTQIRGMNQAARNANDGISLAQTAEGALGEIGNNLQRIRELAVQSRNATNSADDRAALQKEVSQLKSEIDRVANQTTFNGTKLLDGSFTAQAFQVGANQGQTITVDAIADANIAALGTWNSVAQSNASGAAGTFTQVDLADTEEYSLEVDGVSIISVTGDADGESVTAADIDAQLADSTVQANLATAGVTVSGTAAGGDLKFTKTDGSAIDIVVANDAGANGFGGADFATGTNTVDNGAAAAAQTGFASLDISTAEGADNAILAMDAALNSVNSARADLGAVQNRFTSVIANLNTTAENLTASRSRIRDTDFAKETAELTRTQILTQAGTAMLAQANQAPQGVLSLLR
ncbi:flagellin [Lysobacter yangpyeongensis]|uniref:Flagellin n=1 Tax=Lysobacter yangpyeongensis TaxID=346182 RepID=A0ABW0SJ70_9GAMM